MLSQASWAPWPQTDDTDAKRTARTFVLKFGLGSSVLFVNIIQSFPVPLNSLPHPCFLLLQLLLFELCDLNTNVGKQENACV